MVYFIEPETKMVSLQNLLSLEELSERIRAENTESARLNQEKMSIDNEVPFVRQGSGRRPGPLPLQPNGTPTRMRHNFDLAGINITNCSTNSKQAEIEARLQEIIKLTGIITVDGKRYYSSIHDLEHQGELGFGSCGHVVKMRHPPSNAIIAVKQMRRSGNREENKRITMDLEVVLKSHDCPYIVQCLGCFVTESDVWICMELMATCFDKLLKRLRQPIIEPIIGKIAVATVKALHYLKETHGVIHRDVKPSNILLDERGNVKLCDFGISGWLEDSKAKTRSAGCAAYMAPERIEPPDPSHPDYDIRADVWSLGITLVEMATGNSPYRDCQTDFEVLARVVRDDPPLLSQSQGFSPELCSFVRDCLTKNYKHRPKYKKLLEHPFIKKYEALPIEVSVWYQTVIRQIESNQLVRQSPQRTSQRMYTPPSPSLRRVTSEPPPIPPRTPESQRKPLLVRLASEPVVDGLDFQTVNGRVTVVGTKQSQQQQQQQQQQQFQFDPKPPAGKPSPPVTGPVGPGGFRFNLPLRPPALPPRPPPTGGNPQQQSTQLQTSPSEETQPSLGMRGFNPSRVTNPPTDLPGLPPRPPPAGAEATADRNSSSVARLAQMFGTQLSPARSPTTTGRDPNEIFNLPPNRRPADSPPVIPPRLSPESANPPPRAFFSEGLLARISQDPLFSRLLKPSSSSDQSHGRNNGHHQSSSDQRSAPSSSLFGRRISSEGLSLRSRYSPSPPQHPPPQPPARRLSQSSGSGGGNGYASGGGAGSASVPASPVLQPRHMGENVNPFSSGYVLPRHLTPEPQRRSFSQRFEL
ncbi:dual specificity mitogen-activated protein kinase kinase hemipterous-like isoform X1 [Daphnia carinata]|uniref:dual specificity mitogen-activated protein kinase kinase hemipterous-like isoform X1 n=1 Tax=Daphnia carinata TaxID=120202 RepID=UPI0028684F47|nr:dual specificity mitogen-activated protein kinase kinase hemipterous-like isoform X1 [Daphnia carinata]